MESIAIYSANDISLEKLLKVDDNFTPYPTAAGDEMYPNGIFYFNITKLIEYVQENKNDIILEEVSVRTCSKSSSINESHIDSVDTSQPVILAEIAPQRYNMIDGNHRVEKARRLGIDTIMAYRLTVDQHIKFLTDKDAYISYIGYWNDKVKNIVKHNLSQLYLAPRDNAVQIEVPTMNFLMIDGDGDPNESPSFQGAIETLFSLSYTLKFMAKKGPQAIDFGVMPLEGLWWTDDMTKFNAENKSGWKWTLMIMQPPNITQEMVITGIEKVRKKKNVPPSLSLVRFESFSEGKVAQIIHIGPFSEEGPTIEKLHLYIKESGFQLTGKHHEIYLSDIRKAAPSKWKTILRQPIS